MCPLIQIKGRGRAAVRLSNGPKHAVHPALADLDGHPCDRLCLYAFQRGGVWLAVYGHRDSLMRVCVRARCVPASHQNAPGDSRRVTGDILSDIVSADDVQNPNHPSGSG
jgi:hypothetical protein